MSRSDAFDVVVAGGGPAGSAAALSLRRHFLDLRVAIVDATEDHARRPMEALPSAAAALLQRIGAWESLVDADFPQSPAIAYCWGTAALSENHGLYSPWGSGWHLERHAFDEMLRLVANDHEVDLRRGARVSESTHRDGRWSLRLTNGDTLTARFVLDATGRSARFARAHGARHDVSERLMGFGRFFDDDDGDPRTLVEAVPEGWWYSCRAPGRRVVVFMTDATTGRTLRLEDALAQTQWMRRLVGHKRGKDPFILQAFSARLPDVGGREWLAVGDAASAMSPLSGAGLTRALRSGITASYAVGAYLTSGDEAGLKRYRELGRLQFETYLDSLARFHALETRWPRAPFWAARHRAVSSS